MKKLILLLIVLIAIPAMANETLTFSTGPANGDSWNVTGSNGSYTMTFSNLEVDNASTADAILNDFVGLPSMTFSNIVDDGTEITALLTPSGNLTISDDTSGQTKYTAAVGSGGFLTIGTNWLAYSPEASDLSSISGTEGYSAVIDDFLTTENSIDLSFGGDSASALYDMLSSGDDGTVEGTLSGQISVVPAPGAFLLGGIGLSIVGYIKKRRMLN